MDSKSAIAAVLALALAACSEDDDAPGPVPPVPQAPSLLIASGSIPAADVGPAARDLAVLRAVLSAGNAQAVRVDAFAVRAAGTVEEPVDVLAGSLYADDGDGVFEPAQDTLIQGAMTFSADDGVLLFAPARAVPAGGTDTWWVALDLSGLASFGETVQVSVPDASYVSATAVATSAPVVPTGLPVNGPLLTIGHEWVQLQTAGTSPPDLWGYSLVFDAANQRLVLFGGKDGSGSVYNAVWALDLSASPPAWSQLLTGGPVARYGHVAAYVQFPQPRMAMFGGWDPALSAALADTWELGLSSGAEAWSAVTVSGSMSPTVYACACWPAASSDMILFGGCDEDPLVAPPPTNWYGGIHRFHFTATGGAWTYWGNGTYGAGGACMADDSASGRVLVFGGWFSPGGVPQVVQTGFSFSWSTGTLSALSFASPPAARWLSSWTVRASDQRAYLFGGRDLSAPLGDFRAWDLSGGTWSSPSPVIGGPPAARFGHSAVVLGTSPDRLYLFTGSPAGGSVWTFR
jgi:hypothetical protein